MRSPKNAITQAERLLDEAEKRIANHASALIEQRCGVLGSSSSGVKSAFKMLVSDGRWEMLIPALLSIPRLAVLLQTRRTVLCEYLTATPAMATLLWISIDDPLFSALVEAERLSKDIETLIGNESSLQECQRLFAEADKLRCAKPQRPRWTDLRIDLFGTLHLRVDALRRDPEASLLGDSLPGPAGDPYHWLARTLRMAGQVSFGSEGPPFGSDALNDSSTAAQPTNALIKLLEKHGLLPRREQAKTMKEACGGR